MKIAITDLKDYNEAILRYKWLDLEECLSKDEISDFIEQFLAKRSKETNQLHEEWFVTDYEEFVDLGEYPNLDDIETATNLSQEHAWEVISAYYSCYQEFEHFEEDFVGIYEDEEDFAYELAQDIYSEEQMGGLSVYIDWERFARDLFIGDDYSEKLEKYKIVIFRRW